MKNKLTKCLMRSAAVMTLPAGNCAAAGVHGGHDFNLNAASGLSDAWFWIPIAIVAMLVAFLSGAIILGEFHCRPNKTLKKTLRGLTEAPRQNPESSHP
jgi:hypothetical protein